ncbi:hypothetical protein CASFOL_039739 [Castilleja foliolosa]|uniref:Uncharacterized protein n=1 Tax=Castilleja foliolosa TaxID=1961234 RepID=A0ABD3BGE1_9LAMI
MAVRKLSSTLKKLLAPPLHLPFINPPSISQNFTKSPLFAKPFSSQPGLGNEAIATQQLSNYVMSGRADDWKSHEEDASDSELEWERPEEGFIKVNVRTAFCLAPVKVGAIASVFRDSLAHQQCGFIQPFYNGRYWPGIEYLAIFKSVNLASYNGYMNVVIESVNKEVVDTITEYINSVKNTPTLTYDLETEPDSEMTVEEVEREFLKLIAWRIPPGGTYRFVHVYKEVNRLADYMAINEVMKEASDGLKVFESELGPYRSI